MKVKIIQMVQFRDGVLALGEDGDLYWGRFDEFVGEIIWTRVPGPTR